MIVKESGEKKEIEAEESGSNSTAKVPAKWKNRIEKDEPEEAQLQPQQVQKTVNLIV